MSSGPGILQNQILSFLKVHNSYVFKNVILWNLAFQRSEIIKGSEISKDLTTGFIKNSFQENFRRATKSLIENGRIVAKKEKITDIAKAFENFPYLTPVLEIHTLRKVLLPSVLEYIQKKRYLPKFGTYKIEEETAKRMPKKQKKLIIEKWYKIERKIALILSECEGSNFDLWLNCMARGRNIFSNSGPKSSWALVGICSELKKEKFLKTSEIETLSDIENLMHSNFKQAEWALGECKSIYYSISDMSKGSSGKLNEEVKRFLHDKHEYLIESLPDHKEPESHKVKLLGKTSWMQYGNTQYSPLLDKILTKQILRQFTFIKLSM